MSGAEPDVITNHGQVWLARLAEWVRFDRKEEIDAFIDRLIEARDKAFQVPKERAD